ncbi:hypothetical protein MCOR29_005553 [Pyricularia oryzae]|uniref:Protein kinase domain-containing protein n=1 Tax=Pyricularia grisea TaxID=148305 RepID=A0ABQ8N446_PYRGI|nr:hypothetical protein MCOR01_001369 [Pyricularia oryzae]KAI6290915.1 hypothetical protein MCOR33_010972 [Pyricularia grisea]KAI6277511.1 hypothetical protein MCOR26_005154 [Pyricularia oryzae]KAI6319458.1 hypothetical protein MCOR29_005553 [Pyricularia oryzae]KAI6385128.1 hypothetical protein MCOR32_001728 [Pyricularia oryzae]
MASGYSSDEGEIVENGDHGVKKATTLPHREGASGVDRTNRNRGRPSRSPEPGYRSGSPRGSKRARADDRDYYNGSRGGGGSDRDPRRFRVHYEESSRRRDRPSRQYEDLDRPGASGPLPYDDRDYRYDDRDGDKYPDKRARHRSRSPYRSTRAENGGRDRGSGRGDGHHRDRQYQDRDQAESIKYSAHNDRQPRDETMSKRARPVADDSSQRMVHAKSVKGVAEEHKNGAKDDKRDPGSKQSESQAEDWEPPSVVDEEAEIERRRRRREELLRKSRASTPMQQQLLAASAAKLAVSTPESTQANTPQRTEVNTPRSDAVSPDRSPAQANDAGTPEALDMFTEQDLVNTHNKGKSLDEDGPSAADYDPTADRKEDERRDEMRHGNVGLHGEGPNTNNASALGNGEVMEQETDTGAPKAADDEDDDDFDMFSTAPPERYVAPKKSAQAAGAEDEAGATQLAQGNGGGILEGDDKDGYYKIRPGEILDGRYQIQSALGKGMFSGVARAMDITNKKLVAIKIMRNNDALRKGGFTEIAILQKLNDADPENKKHIVKFERSFEYKGHLCMAFENLSLNLREVLKKFGNNVGINLRGVRAYAYQIFLALGHMRRCSIIHADLKPDNILVNDQRNVLKICDLGTAIDRSDAATAHNEITPYLVSRFYRAPEIILGIPYDYAADMWSIGCTLYEMYTGKILFTGDSNNQMLRAIMEIRGKMSRKLYQRGELWQMHFDEVGNFFSQERDKVLGKRSVAVALLVSRSRMRRRTNNDKWRGNNSIFTSPASFSRTRDSEDAPRQDNLSAESPHPSTSTRLKTRPFGPCVGDFNYAQRVGF